MHVEEFRGHSANPENRIGIISHSPLFNICRNGVFPMHLGSPRAPARNQQIAFLRAPLKVSFLMTREGCIP
jgi:hypothetical protein